ncbi:MAG TPA: DEAD/DEAH box helicase [Candidatus Nitrosotenuis sp.]|nr:DEAD/DEAH box helicase [Candidatus Nitrosotenuis sp.]
MAAISRLRELIRPADLRKLLTPDLERLVARCEASDRLYRTRMPDDELAVLLLDLHGPELLRQRPVRVAILEGLDEGTLEVLFEFGEERRPRSRREAIQQIAARKWHAGKRWPRFFVRTVGLPGALAGTPDDAQPPDLEELEPYVPLPPLHDFQVELRDRLRSVLQSPEAGGRAILSLPTGAGKTRTMVEALVEHLREGIPKDGVVLWIAQSEELCEQAVQAFKEVWTHQTVQAAGHGLPDPPQRAVFLRRLWSARRPAEDWDRGVVVASIQKLDALSRCDGDELAPLRDAVRIVVVDEAHHAIAPSYTHVFSRLDLAGRGASSRVMIGLTATPYRGGLEESKRLINRFHGNLLVPDWEEPMEVLRRRRVLSQIRSKVLETGRTYHLTEKDLGYLRTFHDLPEDVLKRIGQDWDRNRLILQCLLDLPRGKPVLFFACSVLQACAMALLLRRQGRTAAAVTGETPRSMRRAWIQDFKEGRVQFLCNYGVLTTGFDAPKVEVVVLARPTSSVLLYEQMVGRGMRGPANGGTEECLVVDLADNIPNFGEQMSYQRYRDMWGARQGPSRGLTAK